MAVAMALRKGGGGLRGGTTLRQVLTRVAFRQERSARAGLVTANAGRVFERHHVTSAITSRYIAHICLERISSGAKDMVMF